MSKIIAPTFFTLVFVCGIALSGERVEGYNPLDSLNIPKPEAGGEWQRVIEPPISGGGVFSERWNWVPMGDTKMSPTITAEFRSQVPPPAPSEAARAFGRAASRASYANSVSDESLPDGGQWVEYTLSAQGEAGFKKIIQVDNGIVTLTLATSANFDPPTDSYDATLWGALQKSLLTASFSEEPDKGEKQGQATK